MSANVLGALVTLSSMFVAARAAFIKKADGERGADLNKRKLERQTTNPLFL